MPFGWYFPSVLFPRFGPYRRGWLCRCYVVVGQVKLRVASGLVTGWLRDEDGKAGGLEGSTSK
jgi:hypothetical protein